MLSEEEKAFVNWWKTNRDREKKLLRQWLVGLPLGLLFGVPVLINFFSGWYKRADMEVNSQLSNHEFSPLVLLIALLLIISFVAIFSKRHKWEMNEQRYKELQSSAEDQNNKEQEAAFHNGD